MKYSHKYKKLEKDVYTTIRRYPKGKKGDVIMETYPGGHHKAVIHDVFRIPLSFLGTGFLKLDTDCDTRQDAIDLIKSFYKKPIDLDREKFYVYIIKRLKDV